MNALREQQLAFAAAVREGAKVDALLKPRINGEPALVGIYRHAYIDAHPSRFASIRWFGDG